MATTIKVNGMSISIDGNTAKKVASKESVINGIDPSEYLIKASEAAVMVDIMGNALNSITSMSTEGVGDQIKGVAGKVAAGTKKVWDAIIKFFKNMINYITSFVSGNVIHARAKVILSRINALGDKAGEVLASNAGKKIKAPAGVGKTSAAIRDKMATAEARLNKTTPTAEFDKINANFTDLEKQLMANPEREITVKEALSLLGINYDIGSIKGFVESMTKGQVKALIDLKKIAEAEKAELRECEALAKNPEVGENTAAQAYKIKVKIQNLLVKQLVGQTHFALTAIAAAVTVAKDEKKKTN